ncbi:VOC family protein [Streptomyces boninensis]|uniref:VOC family protein n=1 Tax=Streptomyces boninensis TaxID=2039455 RepID=UPI003B213433
MIGELECIVLDCPDPRALAEFYGGLLGGEVNRPDPRWGLDDDFATLHPPAGGLPLCFQRAADYRPPRWPDPAHPQQAHLDIAVGDLPAARTAAEALGATPLQDNPDLGWVVMADPAGHPFCLLPRRK